MEILLKKDVANLGYAGEIVKAFNQILMACIQNMIFIFSVFIVNKVLHFVKNKDSIHANRSIVKISYNIPNILDRIISDGRLMNVRHRI